MKNLNIDLMKSDIENRTADDAMLKSIESRCKAILTENRYQVLLDTINLAIVCKNLPETETLTQFAYFVTYATYKKLYSVSGNKHILKLWYELSTDIAILDRTHNTHDNISNSMDNVQEAIVKIIEMCNYCIDNDLLINEPFTTYRQGKSVVLHGVEITKEFLLNHGYIKTVETSGIREIYRHVRRYIDNQNTVGNYTSRKNPKTDKYEKVLNVHTYFSELESVDVDDNTTLDLILYHRCGKYADIGSFDNIGNYWTDADAVKRYDDILSQLELTDRQKTIINYRMAGNGYKKTAKLIGISESNVKMQINRIREKAIRIGLFQFIPEKKAK